MKLIKKLSHRFIVGALILSLGMTPLTVRASQDTEPQQEAASNLPDSNTWANWPAGPSVAAESAIVMEADTGMILYAKNIDAKNYPASITKIMTALVTLEQCELDEEITYSYHATHSIEYGSSSIARTEGEILTVEESLYALMLESANECANALAEHISGSTEEFAKLMNAKAKELGCTNTNFMNANGLHDENHYTSAHDMALITQAAIANEDFRTICSTKQYILRATNKNDEQLTMNNHHYMISAYKTSKFLDDTVFAGKTGYTSDALNTLVTCATRNGMDIIAVTMRTASSGVRGEPLFSDTALLLDYADNFRRFNIAENETTFIVDNAYSFVMDSDGISDTSASLLSIDPEGSIILPKDFSFTDAKPSLKLEEDGEISSAYLTYEYAGQTVGRAAVTLQQESVEEFQFDETESSEEETNLTSEESEEETKFFIINFKIIFIVLGILAVLVILLFLLRAFCIKNRKAIMKMIRNYRKRKALRQRRRRKRRRAQRRRYYDDY